MRKTLFAAVFVIVFAYLAACNGNGRFTDTDISSDEWERAYRYEGDTYLDGRPASASLREEALTEYLLGYHEIESVSVAINGNTAIISLCLTGEPLSDEIIKVKQSIQRKSLAFDESLARVSINCTPELYNRAVDNITGAGGDRGKSSVPPEKSGLYPSVPTF